MEEVELRAKLDALTEKIDKVYISSEKTRKYILWFVVISVLAVVLPVIGLMFEIPSIISTYANIANIQ